MSTQDIEAQVSLLHSAYEKLTGQRLPLKAICDERRLTWQRFIAAKFTFNDLETVIFHIKNEMREKRRNPGALKFRNLLDDLNHFQETLSFARAYGRNAVAAPTPKAIVHTTHSKTALADQTKDTARPIAVVDWLKALREAVDNPGSASQ